MYISLDACLAQQHEIYKNSYGALSKIVSPHTLYSRRIFSLFSSLRMGYARLVLFAFLTDEAFTSWQKNTML